MTYEQRTTTVQAHREADYLRLCREELWPRLRAAGGEVLCILNGLIGAPTTEFLQITRFASVEAWQAAQDGPHPELGGILEREEVRLLKPVASRPKATVPEQDRRPAYGYRRFFIDPADLDEFVMCSEVGIWPRIESQGACILGLWATAAATWPLEVVLLTGYHGPAHWEETRFGGRRPEDVDREAWQREEPLRARRVEMTIRSWVQLMRAHEIN